MKSTLFPKNYLRLMAAVSMLCHGVCSIASQQAYCLQATNAASSNGASHDADQAASLAQIAVLLRELLDIAHRKTDMPAITEVLRQISVVEPAAIDPTQV